MRVKLPESAPDRKRSFGGTAVSTLVHTLLIGGVVVSTGYSAEQAQRLMPPDQVDVVYVEPDRRPPPQPQPPSADPSRPPIPTDVPPVVPPVAPVDLAVVPTGLPPATSTIGTMSVDDFAHAARDSAPATVAAPPGDGPYTELMVERPVRPRDGNPAPRYPAFLASAGVQGTVYAQFVVDTTGRVEAASIRVLQGDHELFARAVREALVRSRYQPAEAGGRRVRQLVEQAFTFALSR